MRKIERLLIPLVKGGAINILEAGAIVGSLETMIANTNAQGHFHKNYGKLTFEQIKGLLAEEDTN